MGLERLFSLLGICIKAGKLLTGFEAVREGAGKGRVRLILLARDLSPKSRKEMEYIAEKQSIPVHILPVAMEEIWYRTGRRAGILALTDQGLADLVNERLSRTSEEE